MSANNYTIDAAHSNVKFWVRHFGISRVHGTFSGVSGTVSYDPANPEATVVEASIDVSTVNTGVADRDGHLKSPDFFDVATYPTFTFKSKSVTKVEDGEFKVTGDLTLHGVTKEVTFDAEVSEEVKSPFNTYKVGASLSGKIAREDFGLTYNQVLEAGGLAIGKDVHIDLDIEFDRPL